MKKSSLYKVFVGRFYMLDELGKTTNKYKRYSLFRNTAGLVFFIHAATKGRCYALYFARDDHAWNYRTVFPTGLIIEENNCISIKTRYNTFVWDATSGPTSEQTESLFQWVKENGETYIPGLMRHEGMREYFDRDHYSV